MGGGALTGARTRQRQTGSGPIVTSPSTSSTAELSIFFISENIDLVEAPQLSPTVKLLQLLHVRKVGWGSEVTAETSEWLESRSADISPVKCCTSMSKSSSPNRFSSTCQNRRFPFTN